MYIFSRTIYLSENNQMSKHLSRNQLYYIVFVEVYYPSHDFHGPSLIASYTWGYESDTWLSMNETQALELVSIAVKNSFISSNIIIDLNVCMCVCVCPS